MEGHANKECIVISGSHRSGTSALTRLFGIAGVTMPATLMETTVGNEAGHWESQPIVDFNDVFLGQLSSAWNDWASLDIDGMSEQNTSLYTSNMKELLSREYGDSSLIALKDPRICRFQSLTAEVLSANGYTPKFAIITRNPLEVGKSLEARNQIPEKVGVLLWLRHVLDAEFYSRGHDRAFISFGELMSNPGDGLKALWSDLSITQTLDYASIEDELSEYVRPDLRHYESSLADIVKDEGLADWVANTFSILKSSSGRDVSSEDQKTLDRIRTAFDAAVPLLKSVLSSYEDKQAEIVAHRDSLSAQLVGLEVSEPKLAALMTEIVAKDQSLTGLTKQFTKLKAENETALTLNAEIEVRKRELESDLATSDEALRQRNLEVVSYKEQLDIFLGDVNKSEQAIETLEAEKQALLAQIESASAQAAQAAQKLAQSKEHHIASIADLQSKIEMAESLSFEKEQSLKAELSDLDKKQKTATKSLMKWKETSEDLSGQLLNVKETLDAAITRHTVELTEKSKALRSVKSKLGHRERSIAKLEVRAEAADVENAKLSAATGKLKTDFKALKRASKQTEKSLSEKLTEEEQAKSKLNDDLVRNKKEIEDLSWRVDNLHGQLVAEMSSNSSRAAQLDAMYQSSSWKMTAFPRKMINLWRNRTLLLVGLVAGKEARVMMSDNTGLQDAAMHSKSQAVSLARQRLADERETVLESSWLKYKAGVQEPLSDEALPRITMSAVTYNSEKWLWNFFLSLEVLDYPLDKISINFVDNGSTDNTCKAIEAFIKKADFRFGKLQLFNRPNLGFGVGHDYGISQSDDEFVLVTNVDMEFYPSSLREVANAAIFDDKDVACWELRQAPYEHPKYYDPVTMLTNWNAHACVLFRRAAYKKIGGYEKRIFMYGEDVELSYRFRANGWKLRYVPNAVVTHYVDMEDTTVRPHQLSGSTSANLLLRYRYGSAQDVIAGEAFFAAVNRNETEPVRIDAWNQVKQKLKKDRLHFIRKRKWNTKAKFPFREFDYDDARPGGTIPTEPYNMLEKDDLPLVTIVTRTHGPSDHFLNNCIASVLNQTYPNIEHIIVEDRTDDGEAVVNAVRDVYGDRIRYLKSPGQGRSDCGNFGASQARGDYICWLDNDDLFYADHIETLMRGFEKDPAAVCSYAMAWEAIGDNVDGKTTVASFNLPGSHAHPYDKKRFLIENFIPIQAIVFRKELFDQLGGFNPDLTYLEDWNLWARYAEMGNFVFTPRVTSMYVTPNDEAVRQKRHLLLHDAYEDVRKLTINDTSEIRKRFFSGSSLNQLEGSTS